MSIVGEFLKGAKEGMELVQTQQKYAREEKVRKETEEIYPYLEVKGGINCKIQSLKEVCDRIVFDFYKGIDYDDAGEVCLYGDYEYVPVSLKLKNAGTGVIKKVIIDNIYMCAESKVDYERKLDRGMLIQKLICEKDIVCGIEISLNEDEIKEVVFLFSSDQYWMTSEEFEDRIENGPLYMEMDIRLISRNNECFEQKGLWCEFDKGKIKECERGVLQILI